MGEYGWKRFKKIPHENLSGLLEACFTAINWQISALAKAGDNLLILPLDTREGLSIMIGRSNSMLTDLLSYNSQEMII